ncbi:hypothetical protein [Burkholderia sp. BCC1977]|uniref:hypothetical protein n=1 Tax=Burkholderia sp. BCC1977 TaxID=2817440 RepID=UPI002ABDAF02|nr:hypothetical protein [Burkholderia sp. BCC1977]
MRTRRDAGSAGTARYLYVVAVAVLALSIGVAGTRHAEPEAAAVDRVRPSLAAAGADAFSGAAQRIAPDDRGLAVTENRELIVNAALLDLIDAFLLKKTDADRADRLKVYLQNRLPSPANREAIGIAERYQAYMQAHDDLLAAQNLGRATDAAAVDIERIAIWRQQRDRLRQRMLGDEVVQAWYRNDDAQLDQVLGEWRQRAEDDRTASASAPAREPDYPVPRWRSTSDEEHHRRYMLAILDKAVSRYDGSRDEKPS